MLIRRTKKYIWFVEFGKYSRSPAKVLALLLELLGFLLLDEFADFLRSPDKPEDSERQHSDPNEQH